MQIDFWHMYSMPEPNLQRILNKSREIEAKKKKIANLWKGFEKENSKGFMSPYLMYGVYLESINNLPSSSYNFITRELANTMRQQDLTKSKVINDSNVFSPQVVQVTISMNKESLGTVLSCSPTIQQVLGYPKANIIGKNINAIMPYVYANNHNEFLLRNIEEGNSGSMNVLRKVFVFNDKKELIPIVLHIAMSPFMQEN